MTPRRIAAALLVLSLCLGSLCLGVAFADGEDGDPATRRRASELRDGADRLASASRHGEAAAVLARSLALDDSDEARSALARELAATPRLAWVVPGLLRGAVVAASPSGDRIAVGDDGGGVHVLALGDDLAARQTLHAALVRSTAIEGLAWSPDGARLAVLGGRRVVVATPGSELVVDAGRVLVGAAYPRCIAWSECGERLAIGGDDGVLRILSATDLSEVETARAHRGAVTAVAIAEGAIVTGGSDGFVRWHARPLSGEPGANPTGRVLGRGVGVTALAVSGAHVVVGRRDGAVDVVSSTRGEAPSAGVLRHRGSVTGLAVLAGPRAVSAGADGTFRIVDLETARPGRAFQGHTGRLRSIAAIGAERHLVTIGDAGELRVWDVDAGDARKAEVARDPGHHGSVHALAIAGDGLAASASSDATIRLWDGATGAARAICWGHEDTVTALAWHPDGDWLASASVDGAVRVWDVSEVRARPIDGRASLVRAAWVKPLEKGRLAGIAWSGDGSRLAVATADGRALVIALGADLEERPTSAGVALRRPASSAPGRRTDGAVAWVRDRVVWRAPGGEVVIAHARTGAALRVLEPILGAGADVGQAAIAVAPDESRLAVAEAGGGVTVREIGTGAVTARADSGAVVAIAWRADGTLVTADADGALRLRAEDLAVTAVVPLGRGVARAVAISPDGARVIASGGAGTVYSFLFAPGGAPKADGEALVDAVAATTGLRAQGEGATIVVHRLRRTRRR